MTLHAGWLSTRHAHVLHLATHLCGSRLTQRAGHLQQHMPWVVSLLEQHCLLAVHMPQLPCC